MFFLVFLALVGCCSAKHGSHRGRLENVTFSAMPDNPYVKLHTYDGYPKNIEYLQRIEPVTGLMVRVSFSDESGLLDDANANEAIHNICDILDRALFEPESIEARYNMASHFGMTGSTCPIEAGMRDIQATDVSIEFTIMDFGDGEGFYIMTVEMENRTLVNDTIMEVQVNFETTRSNETSAENSSVVISKPSITASIVTALIAITFTR